MQLKNHIDVYNMAGLSSAATKTSTALDLAGAEGCLFMVNLSTKAQGSTAIVMSLTASTALAGTYVAYGPGVSIKGTTGATKNNRTLLLDLYKPLKRYAKVVVSGGSSGTMYLNNIIAVKYGLKYPGSSAVPAGSTTVASTACISPTSS